MLYSKNKTIFTQSQTDHTLQCQAEEGRHTWFALDNGTNIKCVNGECCSQVLGHPGEQCGTTTRESEWRAAVSSMRRLARAMTGKFNPNTFWLLSRSHIGWTPWKVGRWGSVPQRPSFVTEVQTIPTCLSVCTSLPGSLASKYTADSSSCHYLPTPHVHKKPAIPPPWNTPYRKEVKVHITHKQQGKAWVGMIKKNNT